MSSGTCCSSIKTRRRIAHACSICAGLSISTTLICALSSTASSLARIRRGVKPSAIRRFMHFQHLPNRAPHLFADPSFVVRCRGRDFDEPTLDGSRRMPQINETVFAPALDGGEWIQHGPVNLKELRGKAVVLIDFWDYTCVNCIHTLPYVSAWHRRYGKDGLVVVGVHAPEFSFARDHANVRTAIKQFGLEYPVVLDNGYIIWRAYSNRYWPAKYLVDTQGKLRYYHFGEGLYQETESQIQRLLGELNPA